MAQVKVWVGLLVKEELNLRTFLDSYVTALFSVNTLYHGTAKYS